MNVRTISVPYRGLRLPGVKIYCERCRKKYQRKKTLAVHTATPHSSTHMPFAPWWRLVTPPKCRKWEILKWTWFGFLAKCNVLSHKLVLHHGRDMRYSHEMWRLHRSHESSFDKSKKAIKVFGVYIGRLLESWNIHTPLAEGLTYTCWMTQKWCRNDAKNIYRKVVRYYRLEQTQ